MVLVRQARQVRRAEHRVLVSAPQCAAVVRVGLLILALLVRAVAVVGLRVTQPEWVATVVALVLLLHQAVVVVAVRAGTHRLLRQLHLRQVRPAAISLTARLQGVVVAVAQTVLRVQTAVAVVAVVVEQA